MAFCLIDETEGLGLSRNPLIGAMQNYRRYASKQEFYLCRLKINHIFYILQVRPAAYATNLLQPKIQHTAQQLDASASPVLSVASSSGSGSIKVKD